MKQQVQIPSEVLRRVKQDIPKEYHSWVVPMYEKLLLENTDVKLIAQHTKISEKMHGLVDYKELPVGIEEFIESNHYLKRKDTIYPLVMEELITLNNPENGYEEAVLTGSIGAGKTTMAVITTAYQLYLLMCMRHPHKTFRLLPSDEILFVFQSINERLARRIDYARFKSLLEGAPFFNRGSNNFRKDIESRLVFRDRIEVIPVSGSETAAIGQNVIGGVIDEMNFMDVVEKSKQNPGEKIYDQATALYNSIVLRRKSRFIQKDRKLPGLLCLVSSKRYPGQFTDRKVEEADRDLAERGKTPIFVYDKCTWDIKPEAYSKQRFRVFIGDMSRRPRILKEEEKVDLKDKDMIKHVPMDYRSDFDADIIKALRDVASVSTLARHPFFIKVEQVASSFGTRRSVLSLDTVDFETDALKIFPRMIENPEAARFIHGDLAITGDAAGVCCGYVEKFVKISRGAAIEMWPLIHIDFLLQVRPPNAGEIEYEKIRRILYRLREYGMNIKWASFDSFQSVDSIQILRGKGVITGIQSVDKTTDPYDLLKVAIYDGRCKMPSHYICQGELLALEKDVEKAKIDHPPHGSKDVADALAGVVYGLHRQKWIWAMHGVPMYQVPEIMKTMAVESVGKMRGGVREEGVIVDE